MKKVEVITKVISKHELSSDWLTIVSKHKMVEFEGDCTYKVTIEKNL